MYITIVRHSIRNDTDNPEKYKGTENNDAPLSQRGIDFAYNKSNELNTVLKSERVKISKCYSSPFKRTIHTAQIYGKILGFCDKEIIIDPFVAEGQNFKPPNGIPDEILYQLKSVGIEYPESLEATKERCKKFLDKIIKEKKSCMVSTHGIIYNMLLQNIFPDYKFDPYLKSKDYIPRYCYATILKYEPLLNKWSIIHSDVDIKN